MNSPKKSVLHLSIPSLSQTRTLFDMFYLHSLPQPDDNEAKDVFVLKVQSSAISHKNEVIAFTHFRNHPSDYIVQFYGSFIQDEMRCLILEFVDGGNLADYLRNTPPPKAPTDRLRFWQSYSGILKGIHCIHSIEDGQFRGCVFTTLSPAIQGY